MRATALQNTDDRLQTRFTGRHVTFLETVNSTNSFISNLISEVSLPEGAAVLASEQTQGRGQANEQWISEPEKNLLISFVFFPSFLGFQNLFMLSKTFSLGIYD